MKMFLVTNCYKCPYHNTNGNICILSSKPLTVKDSTDVPEWCPLPDADPRSSEFPRYFYRTNKFTNENFYLLAYSGLDKEHLDGKINIAGVVFSKHIDKPRKTLTGISWEDWTEITHKEFWDNVSLLID